MKIVLISTYELGRQPFGLVSPAAWLRHAGHDVTCLDLARQELDENVIRAAELIAIYLPMHTATRLAASLFPRLKALHATAHFCAYGLYAPMNEEYLRNLGVSTVLGGEFEAEMVKLVARLESPAAAGVMSGDSQAEQRISLERLKFQTPDRAGLMPVEKYAHLVIPGQGYRIVGSTEASRGCKHLCRHCPIVPVYKGVFRVVGRDVVMEDVRQQIGAGAQHISFGDPDFFNGIRYALELVEEFHREFPGVSYDVTIKIEHLHKHAEHLRTLRDTGCLLVISAVESVDDDILQALDKGHTRQDFIDVTRKFRELGMTLHPTFVPFTPWTTLNGYLDILHVLDEQELVANVAPIQLGIRLLIPEGSRMLELEFIRSRIGPFDREMLVYPWKNNDPRLDELSETVQALAAAAERNKEHRTATFAKIWAAAHAAARKAAPARKSVESQRPVPFLSEPWYCCAEPTSDQFVSVGAAKIKSRPASANAAGFV